MLGSGGSRFAALEVQNFGLFLGHWVYDVGQGFELFLGYWVYDVGQVLEAGAS